MVGEGGDVSPIFGREGGEEIDSIYPFQRGKESQAQGITQSYPRARFEILLEEEISAREGQTEVEKEPRLSLLVLQEDLVAAYGVDAIVASDKYTHAFILRDARPRVKKNPQPQK